MENEFYETAQTLAYDPIDQFELNFDDPDEQPGFDFDIPAPDRQTH